MQKDDREDGNSTKDINGVEPGTTSPSVLQFQITQV